MLARARGDLAAVGQDHVDFEEVVDSEAVAAREVTDSAAQREASDTSRGDEPARHRQPEGVGGVIDVTPHGAAGDPGRAIPRIDPDSCHRRQIEDEPAVARPETRPVVRAAAHGERQPVLPGEADARDDVRGIPAFCDQRRAAVDHRVVDLAGRFVRRVGRCNQLTPELAPQLLNRVLVHIVPPPDPSAPPRV